MQTDINKKDLVNIDKDIFVKIVQEVISEQKSLFVGKSYLKLRNPNNIFINVDDKVTIVFEIDKTLVKDIDKFTTVLEKEITSMVNHITGYDIKAINFNINQIREDI